MMTPCERAAQCTVSRTADQNAGQENQDAAEDDLKHRDVRGVSMKRWRIQEITPSSTITTATAIPVAR